MWTGDRPRAMQLARRLQTGGVFVNGFSASDPRVPIGGLTPQLLQSIRLLQLTHIELERFIDDEIERNPLLERAEPQDDAASEPEQKSEAASEPGADGDWFESEAEWSAEAISEKLDSSLENLFPDDPGTRERLGPDLTAQWKSA
ncbi:hypothetical protein EN798_33060, partial [bacterium M00.F.Ca.ET.155.01.1.1]